MVEMSGPDTADDPLIGAMIADKYRVESLVGRGGMGAVYEATNVGIGKRVALKFLDRDGTRDLDAVARFQREAEAASAVESAHIVQIFDSGVSADGRPFLVLELLRGEDLRARLRREGRLSEQDTLKLAVQVLRALSRAHAAGIIHRDLKPDNLFLCARDDDPAFVKIVDFGISKVARRRAGIDTLTRRGTVLGTAFYMSPEQAQAFADVDGRTDLFSLGAILYECLAGRPPHVGTAYEAVLIDICTKDAADVRTFAPEVSEPLAKIVAKALARDRAERFASAEAFLQALSAVDGVEITSAATLVRSLPVAGPATTGAAGARSESSTRRGRLERYRVLVAVLVAALTGFVATLLLTRQEPAAAPAPEVAIPAGSEGRSAEPSRSSERAAPPSAGSPGAIPAAAVPSAAAATEPVMASPLPPTPPLAPTPRPTSSARPPQPSRVAPKAAVPSRAAPEAKRAAPQQGVASGLQLKTSDP